MSRRTRNSRRNSIQKRKLIIRLAARDGWKCRYCGTGLTKLEDVYHVPDEGDPWRPTIDHVVPVSKGGREHISNLALACIACNFDKADKDVTEW